MLVSSILATRGVRPAAAQSARSESPVDRFEPSPTPAEPLLSGPGVSRVVLRPENPEASWLLLRRQAERALAIADLARPETSAMPWLRSGDGSVRHLARIKWARQASERSQLEKYCAELGPVEGPAAHVRLKSMFVGKYYSCDKAELEESMQRLDVGVRGQGRASESALQSLLQASRNLTVRMRDPEVDPALRLEAGQVASRAGALLEGWWRDGLCEVAGKTPGSLPLGSLAASAPVAVWGNRLLVGRSPAQSPLWASEQAATIVSQKRPDPLAGLAPERASVLAGAVVEEVLARVTEPEALKYLDGLLKACPENPALTAALRPHLEGLRELARHGRSRNVLGPNSSSSVAEPAMSYYGHLLKAFPEVMDERLVRQLEPLFFDSHGQAADSTSCRLQEIWRVRPELVDCSVKMVLGGLEQSPVVPQSASWRFFTAAGKAGWRPDKLERDFLVHWLAALPDPDEDSGRLALWDSGCFEPAIETLAGFVDRDPGFLEGISLADRQGQLRPVREALLSHLLETPGAGERFTGNENWSQALFQVLAPGVDDQLEKRLLQPLELELEGRASLLELSPEQRNRLSVLTCIPLSEATSQRLGQLLESSLPFEQGHLNRLVERYRSPRMEAHLTRFQAPGASAQERLEAARGAQHLYLHHHYQIYQFNERFGAALQGLDPAAADDLEVHLAERLESLVSSGQGLHQVDQSALYDIQLAATMVSSRPGLLEPLRRLLPSDGLELEGAPNRVAACIRFRIRDFNDERLKESGQPEALRLSWLEENVRHAAAWRGELPEESLQLWAQGATGWVADTCQTIGMERLPEAVRAVRVLMPEDDPAGLLHLVQGRLRGGDLLAQSVPDPELFPRRTVEALEAYREARNEGLGQAAALDRVLGKLSPIQAPISSGVEETPTHVGVGPVRLRRRG
ncbi:hypothetical protein DYH09_18695 [bacterium CPR1]|nr:hypothetical protein [bacterium CPR1]